MTEIAVPRQKTRLWADMVPISSVLAVIAVCEWVFVYWNVAYGILIALFLALAICLVNAILIPDTPLSVCLATLSLIPLYILFTSSLPWFFIDQQYLIPAVYSVVLILCLLYIYHRQLNILRIYNFQWKRLSVYLPLGIVFGIALGAIEYLVLRPAPAFPTFEGTYLLQQTLYMGVFVAVGEELLFRGLIQSDLEQLLGDGWGLVLASVLFGIMHMTWRSAPELVFTFLAGLAFGYAYQRTKSLTMPMVMHCVGNVILVAVIPYLVR
jgi:membrane protease YdiL (CAAX protease family)